jgi:transcriptional regulator with XRE-family HTH domain
MAILLLRKILEKKRISKYQFAKLLGVHYPSVFRYFRKGYDPKLSMLERWAKAIGCRIRDLYKE